MLKTSQTAVVAVMLLASASTAMAAEIIDGVAAIVNDKVITYSEVRQFVQPVVQQLRRNYSDQELIEQVRKAQMDALNSLIERALIIQEFKTKGYKIPETVVDQQINDIISEDYGGNRATFVKTLEAENLALSQYREQVRERVIIQAMRGHKTQQAVVVSPYKIEKYYQDNLDQYKVGDEIKLRMIFIKKTPTEEATTPTEDRRQKTEDSTNATASAASTNEAPATASSESAETTNATSAGEVAVTNNVQAVAPTSTVTEASAVATNSPSAAETKLVETTNAPFAGEIAGTNSVLALAPTSTVVEAKAAVTNIAVAPVTNTVAVGETALPSVDLQRKLADEILAKLDSGESFESMARVYSEGKEAKEGGDWGWIGKDVLRKELNETAFSLKPGQHSRVIVTAEGYYILEVDDVKAAHTTPLAEARDDIEKILLQQQRAKMQEDWVKDLRAKAYIRLF